MIIEKLAPSWREYRRLAGLLQSCKRMKIRLLPRWHDGMTRTKDYWDKMQADANRKRREQAHRLDCRWNAMMNRAKGSP